IARAVYPVRSIPHACSMPPASGSACPPLARPPETAGSAPRRPVAGPPTDIRRDRVVPGRPFQPARLPSAVVRVLVLVAQARQPVRRSPLLHAGLLTRLDDADRRHLERGAGLGGPGAAATRPWAARSAPGRTSRDRCGRRCRGLPGPRALGSTPHADRRILGKDAQPDLLDLVTAPGCPLELEVLRGVPHLGLEPPHELLHLAPRPALQLMPAAAGAVLPARFSGHAQPVVEVVDLPHDRDRRDPVLGVVALLNGASPVRLLDRAVSYTHLRAHETRHDLVC